MKMEAHESIANHQLVLQAFGRWPSFHDAEIHRMVLDRTRRRPNGRSYASVELVVHAWIMTPNVTPNGYIKLDRHHLVHFLFEDVSDLELREHNHQNVLGHLEFKLTGDEHTGVPVLLVDLEPCFGLWGEFKALRASVESVVPYADHEHEEDPRGSARPGTPADW